MSSIHDTLQRESERYTIHHGAFDRMARRRDRKRRNERIAALVVGLAIAIGIVVVGSAMLRSAHDPKPADTKHHSLLREGEVLKLRGDDGSTLVATDIASGAERTLACSDCPQLGEWALSAEGGWIAYTQYPDHPLWVVGANRDPIHVTTEPSCWAWSPSAELLAFAEPREGANELVLLDPATGERTTIVTSTSWISALAWSPDGTQLAVTARSGIQVVVLETGRSTSIAPAARSVDHMSWSPDGTRLVFEEEAIDGRDQIGVVNVDGSDDRILVDHGVQQDQVQPSWSPDGTRIAYVTWSESGGGSGIMTGPRRQGGLSEVWTIGADGSDATRLFHARCCVAHPYAFLSAQMTPGPVWSPDGNRIAFLDLTHYDWLAKHGIYRAVAPDGTGSAEWIDEVVAESWAQGR
jgi:Tol biopolymer transport system component